jgi:hypothetical protein
MFGNLRLAASCMVYPAHVRNGVIVLDEPVQIPEGTAVAVEVPVANTRAEEGTATLLERLSSVVGVAEGLPQDAAANVDHYLYGQSRA